MVQYRMFSVGADMVEDHYWSDDCLPYSMAPYTDWDRFYYTCDQANTQKGYGLYVADAKDAAIHLANEYAAGAHRAHVMVNQRGLTADQLNQAARKWLPTQSWSTWTVSVGNYTMFDVWFYR